MGFKGGETGSEEGVYCAHDMFDQPPALLANPVVDRLENLYLGVLDVLRSAARQRQYPASIIG